MTEQNNKKISLGEFEDEIRQAISSSVSQRNYQDQAWQENLPGDGLYPE